jgi:hypothetical protein
MRHLRLILPALFVLAGAAVGEDGYRADLRVLEGGSKEECVAALARLVASDEPEVLPALLDLIPRSEHLIALKIRKAARELSRRLPEGAVVDAVIGAPAGARVTAIAILSEQIGAGKTEVLAKRLAGPDPTAAAELLGATGSVTAVELLTKTFHATPPGKRVACIRGLALLSGYAARITPLVEKIWSGANAEEQTEIIRAMARLKCRASQFWILRFAISEDFERLVPWFDPCFRQDVLNELVLGLPVSLRALRRLSNQDFGIEDDAWRKWIGRLSAGYEPREGVLPEKAEDAEANAATSHFYGVPLPEGEFVFLLDASSSMGERADGETESLLVQVKQTVLALLEELDEDRRFNVIFFSDRAHAFRRVLFRPTAENNRLVRRFIGKIRAGGNTNYEAGLKAALKDPEVTDILLLSDGAPTRGRVRSGDAVMKLLNGRRVRIHTIGRTIHQPLLKEIARRTGGCRGVF